VVREVAKTAACTDATSYRVRTDPLPHLIVVGPLTPILGYIGLGGGTSPFWEGNRTSRPTLFLFQDAYESYSNLINAVSAVCFVGAALTYTAIFGYAMPV
jgi:hypothetical protein